MQTKRNGRSHQKDTSWLMAMVGGVIIAVIITGIGLCMGAWMLDQNWISSGQKQYMGVVLLVCAAAMLIGSGYAAKVSKERSLLAAIGVAVVYILLRIVLAVGVGDGWKPDGMWWGQSLFQAVAAWIGGMVGNYRK